MAARWLVKVIIYCQEQRQKQLLIYGKDREK